MHPTPIIAMWQHLVERMSRDDTRNPGEDLQQLFTMILGQAYMAVRGKAVPSVVRRLLDLETDIGGENGDFNTFELDQMVDLVVRGDVLQLLARLLGRENALFASLDPKVLEVWLNEIRAADNAFNRVEVGYFLAWIRLVADAIGIKLADSSNTGMATVAVVGRSTEAAPDDANSQPVNGQPWQDPVTGIRFVYVPEGAFKMGDTFDDGVEDEKPVHNVRLSGFHMAVTPVTQAQWLRLMAENPSAFTGDDHPVEQVTLTAVMAFIEHLNQRAPEGMCFNLPTEAQWEYAARGGGEIMRYAGGDGPEAVAWFEDNSPGHTAPVAGLTPNALGLYDMSGNVWEWCRDIYLPDAYRKHETVDPVCQQGGTDRVIRGGSWHLDAWSARCARRFRFDPELFGPALGFRVVMVEDPRGQGAEGSRGQEAEGSRGPRGRGGEGISVRGGRMLRS